MKMSTKHHDQNKLTHTIEYYSHTIYSALNPFSVSNFTEKLCSAQVETNKLHSNICIYL